MQFDVFKPGDNINERPKLSKFGLIVIIAIAALLIIIVGAIILSSSAKKAQALKEQPVILAIERALNICESCLSQLDAPQSTVDEFENYKEAAKSGKDLDQKVNAADKAIAVALKQTSGNQSLTDELNGSRNRIYVAYKEYKE